MGFGVWGSGFRDFEVWGLGLGVLEVWGLGLGVGGFRVEGFQSLGFNLGNRTSQALGRLHRDALFGGSYRQGQDIYWR